MDIYIAALEGQLEVKNAHTGSVSVLAARSSRRVKPAMRHCVLSRFWHVAACHTVPVLQCLHCALWLRIAASIILPQAAPRFGVESSSCRYQSIHVD
jgi:hypothetical protein